MAKSVRSDGESHHGDTLPLQRHSEAAAVWWPPTPEETRPSGIINMDSNLMCFADSDTLRSRREYTHLTPTGVALPEQVRPSQKMVSEGVTLLNLILDLVSETDNILEDSWVADMESDTAICGGPIMMVAWKATSEFVQGLLSDRSAKNMEAASRAIFKQTAQHPVFPPTAEGGAFEAAFSAQNLRWELVGLYCCQTGNYLCGEKDKEVNFNADKAWKRDRKSLMQDAFRACLKCESFCDHLGAVNDLTLWLILEAACYATWCFGDDSYHVLRIAGNMTTIFYALELHKGASVDPSAPFYLVELRKRLIAWTIELDKSNSSFVSR